MFGRVATLKKKKSFSGNLLDNNLAWCERTVLKVTHALLLGTVIKHISPSCARVMALYYTVMFLDFKIPKFIT